MLLGFGTEAAALAAMLHIVTHASFKAALFMTAGIVDHEAGTRSLARLGGLRWLMPLTFAIAAVTALSMAGIPPLNGFLSKEMMLGQAGQAGVGFAILAMIAALFSVAYSLRFLSGVFLGPQRRDYPHRPHDPRFGLWAGPALLAVLVVLAGLFPNAVAGWLVDAAASATTGAPSHAHLALWHGVNLALVLSIIAILGGAMLLTRIPMLRARLPQMPDAGRIYDAVIEAARRAAQTLGDGFTNGSMGRALALLLLTVLACGVLAWSGGQVGPATRPMLPVPLVPAVGWLLLVAASISLLLLHRDRLLALVLIGIVGLIVSVGFVYLSAPDLALTQISVEVVTIILMLLALNFLPKVTRAESPPRRLGADALIATLTGLGFGGLAWVILRRDFAFPSISGYMLDNSYKLGGGDNVVNVILVDFRGYDTYGEVTVLGIAALVIFALAQSILSGRGIDTLRLQGTQAGDRYPMLLTVAARMLLPLALVVGVYMFLRGHNAPGGGLIAGLVVSVALIVQYVASGFGWAQARMRVPFHALIGSGVLVAGLTGIAAWFWDQPFLRSTYGYLHLPLIEPIELASAAAFDLGVFLGVVGAVMLSLTSLARITRRARQGER